MPAYSQPDSGLPAPYVFDVVADDPELGLKAGDRVVVTYGAAWPISVVRELPPNYGRLLGMMEDGAIEPRDAPDPQAVIRQLQRWAALAPPSLRLLPRP